MDLTQTLDSISPAGDTAEIRSRRVIQLGRCGRPGTALYLDPVNVESPLAAHGVGSKKRSQLSGEKDVCELFPWRTISGHRHTC